jgi:hypothetical protein
MDEYIRKQDAVNMFNRAVQDVEILDADDIETVFGMLSSADVAPVEMLKAEIYKLKCQQDSKNQDYYTGYMSALSTVEGILAEMGEE